MKKQIFIFSFLIVAVSFFYNGCKDNNDKGAHPEIHSLDPATGWWVGARIRMLGSGFGNVLADVKVIFSDDRGVEYDAPIVSFASDEIQVTLPDYGTKPDGTKFFVQVSVQGVKSNSVQFTLQKPPVTLDLLNTATGIAGDVISLFGSGFGNAASNVRVTFSNTGSEYNAQIIDVSNEEIRITVPDFGTSPNGTMFNVSVSVADFQSNTLQFTFSGLIIASISKHRGVFDDEIVITGSGFSSIADENEVHFKSAVGDASMMARVVESSPTSLKFISPRLYQSNIRIHVVRNTLQSNTVSFTYDMVGCDSVLIVTADWAIESLRADVVWKKASLRGTFGENSLRVINVIEITPGAGGIDTHVGVAVRPDFRTASTDVFGADLGAIAVINAGYFKITQEEIDAYGPLPVSLHHIRIDNNVAVTGCGAGPGMDPFINACMAFSKIAPNKYEMAFLLLNTDANTGGNERNTKYSYEFGAGINPYRAAGGYDYALTAGPLLINHGERQTPFHTGSHFISTHPRAGVGITADGRILLTTTDGRDARSGAVGVTINQQSILMKALGCVGATSLDGGYSTAMWIQGKGRVSEVFNPPTQQRFVPDVIYVK